jgi:hypothetical protein
LKANETLYLEFPFRCIYSTLYQKKRLELEWSTISGFSDITRKPLLSINGDGRLAKRAKAVTWCYQGNYSKRGSGSLRYSAVAEVLRQFIRLSRLVAHAEPSMDTAFSYRKAGREREIRL